MPLPNVIDETQWSNPRTSYWQKCKKRHVLQSLEAPQQQLAFDINFIFRKDS